MNYLYFRSKDTGYAYFYQDGSFEGRLVPDVFPILRVWGKEHILERHFKPVAGVSQFKGVSPVCVWGGVSAVTSRPVFVERQGRTDVVYAGVSDQPWGLGMTGLPAHVMKVIARNTNIVTAYPDYTIF